MPVEKGQAAPPFTLSDQDGRPVSLSDYRGRNVIVYFYPKDDTPGCTKEAQGFRDLWQELQRRDVVVLGVSPDGPDSHTRFRAKHRLPFTLLADPDKEVMSRYGAFGKKTLYGKLVRGVIRSTVWIDPEGKVRKHWKRVASAAGHPARVLAALDEA
jgi:peroxiredoxin Q/BCP